MWNIKENMETQNLLDKSELFHLLNHDSLGFFFSFFFTESIVNSEKS